jgi:cysteine desulfurase
MKIYFDNAATTPIATEVLHEIIPILEKNYGNPSATHALARESKSIIELARKKVANLLHCNAYEIIFTSGGTEANNMAIKGAVQAFDVKRIITSPIEHHSVLHTVDYVQKNDNVRVQFVQILKNTQIDLDHLNKLLAESNEKTLVSLMHANNEIGTLTDINRVSEICKMHNALLHVDTVQTMAHYHFDLSNIKIDFISGSAHKFHGPKGVGFLYNNSKSKIKSFIHGGGQEREMRAGTENIYGIAGLAKAMDLAYENLYNDKKHIEYLKSYCIELLERNFDDFKINGDSEHSLYSILNFSIDAKKQSNLMLFMLDMQGLYCSGGSACSSGADKGSHVINAIYGNENRQPIRFSFSKYNTISEVENAIQILKQIVNSN